MRHPVILAALLGVLWGGAARADYGAGVRAWVHGEYAEAAAAFLPSARAGDPESQYMMGRLYALGDGVPQDFVRAWLWHDRAARQGHALAAEARDNLTAILNAAQKAQVAALSRDESPARATAAVAAAPSPVPPQRTGSVVLVPRHGVVMEPVERARLAAPVATEEGRLMAGADAAGTVRAVQRALAEAGFDPGPVDGEMGSATRRAIRAYQSAHGAPPDGLLSEALLLRLGVTDVQQAAR